MTNFMFSVCFVFVLVGLSWLALQQAFSSLCMSQTGCGMPLVEWKNPPGVERKGEGGGYCVWVTVGRRRSRSLQIAYWKRRRSGALDGGGLHRVLWGHSLLSSHSQLLTAGLSGRTRAKTLPWCTLLKHAGLGAERGQWGGSSWI